MTVFRSDTLRTFSHNASHNARGIERVKQVFPGKEIAFFVVYFNGLLYYSLFHSKI